MRLMSFLNFSRRVAAQSPESLFVLIKMLADKIFISECQQLAENGPPKFKEDMFHKLVSGSKPLPKAIIEMMSFHRCHCPTTQNIVVNLATAPVLPGVWNDRKLAMMVAGAGDKRNVWNPELYKAGAHLWLPIGLTWIATDGNHSTARGLLERKGEILFTPNSELRVILDVGEIIRNIRFDGTYYRLEHDKGKILCKASSFDFGCIVELGKLLQEYQVSFTA